MAAPTVYRWDDGNAPVARGERRSLCDILYACLVTGYGDKVGAGWTREFVNATFDRAAFRNNPVTGTGFYLRVDGLGGANAYTPKVMGFEVMTSESAGLFPFVAAAATKEMWTSEAAGTTARPWVLIADDRAFYLSIWCMNTSGPSDTELYKAEMFFGDMVPWYLDDAYACCLNVSTYYSYGGDYALSAPSSAGGSFNFPRPISGTSTPTPSALVVGGGPGSASYPGKHGLAYVVDDPVLVSRPYVNGGAEYTLRGWLPGFYYPCHPNAFGQLVEVESDGMTFLSVRGSVGQAELGNYFISLDDWRS